MRALALLCLLARPARSSARVELIKAASGEYRLTGRFFVAASSADAWGVITDYDGISRFVSSVRESRVLRRSGDEAVIEQRLASRFLFVRTRLALTLDVREKPPDEVDFEQTGPSPLREYAGAWHIAASSGGCTVGYRLRVLPGPGLGSRLAARRVLRRDAQELLEEVQAEIERRRSRR